MSHALSVAVGNLTHLILSKILISKLESWLTPRVFTSSKHGLQLKLNAEAGKTKVKTT